MDTMNITAICKKDNSFDATTNELQTLFFIYKGVEYTYFLHGNYVNIFDHTQDYDWITISIEEFKEYFYSYQEIRKLKLDKINESR